MSFWSWIKSVFSHQATEATSGGGASPPTTSHPSEHPHPEVLPRTSKTQEERLVEYERDFAIAEILPGWEIQAREHALLAQVHRARYQAVSDRASQLVGLKNPMPWYVPAILAMMESWIGDWAAYLGNGEHIIGTGKKSSLVPKDRGPFATWEDGALDALASERPRNVINWDVPHLLNFAEGYNGWGYRRVGKRSPYLWSGTNLGVGVGKYVSDGAYDPNAVSKQLGVAAVLKALGVA